MATNKIKLVVKPTRSIPMVVKPVPKIGLMSMAPTKGDPGVGIESLEQTTKSTESGGTNVWTATLTDGTVHDFEVMNGDPGEGIATGGTPGQALVKASTTDYATRWMSILPEDTASGAVASFPDGADDLPMGVVVDIDPVQDLHGYDNPWPGGGGVNKANLDGATNSSEHSYNLVTSFDLDSEIITISGTITPTRTYIQYRFAVFPNIQNGLGLKAFTLSSGAYIGTLSWDGTTQTVVIIARGLTAEQENNLNIKFHMVAYEGSTAPTSWTPYSNICPISGWTGAKVTRTGKNLFDKSKATVGKFLNDALQEIANTGKVHSELIPVKPSTTYFMNGFGGSGFYAMLAVDSDMKRIAWYGGASKSEPFTATTPSNCHYIYLNFNADQIDTMAFYEGNTNKGYIPFDGQTASIPFSTSVYGGTLNVETGELVVDRAIDVITKNGAWYAFSTGTGNASAFIALSQATNVKYVEGIANRNGAISSTGKEAQNYWVTARQNEVPLDGDMCFAYSSGGQVRFHRTDVNAITDLATFKDSFPDTEICYPLATPVTLTLTPVEIRSILGDNNVWADTGDVSVTYKADIQKYIDKKISAAVAAMS